MRLKIGLLALWMGICASQGFAAGTVSRFVLVAGANFGGTDRLPLRYAVSDAEHFARVMEVMGGVEDVDRRVLREPSLDGFQDALRDLQAQVAEASGPGRTEVILYYSGHAHEQGLLLGNEHLSYRGLRDGLNRIQADVHITVLDACASGAITRLKGGQRQQAFKVDTASDMRGYAFLTSSSENEAAQESDRLGASFFTHYLVSGLRGAADISGDGKVTLNEACRFAFQETLDRTTETQGGAQHPAYDIKLSGTGDVVMTDIRQTSAGLTLGEDLDGRFFFRNDRRELVAELYKPAGRVVELGLEAGTYEVHFEQPSTLFRTSLTLEEEQRQVLTRASFETVERVGTRARGGAVGQEIHRRDLPRGTSFAIIFYDYEGKPFGGTQLALVNNYADQVGGSQISALSNIGKSGGLLNLSTWADETGLQYLALMTGGRRTYGLLSVGYDLFDDSKAPEPRAFAAGLGTGVHFETSRLFVESDLMLYLLVDTEDTHKSENSMT